MNLSWVGSPDFTKGRKAYDYIVIHWGVTSNISQIDAEVNNPNREMSYTYAISDDTVHQYVAEENTAWHAGVWDINQRSIGICINAGPNNPYTDKDYETCAELCRAILSRHPGMQIKGHRDFKSTECPGNFSFERLNSLINGAKMERDAIQFEGDTRVYFWAQNPQIAESWYGLDWGSVVRTIKPITVYVDKPVEVIKYVDKPVPYEVDSPATLKEIANLKDKISSLEQENKTLKSNCSQSTIENKPKTLDNKGIWQVIINFLKGVK